MNTTTACAKALLALCLTLGTVLGEMPVYAQSDGVMEVEEDCERSDKIRFHDRSSGFRLEAKCRGRTVWTVTLVGEVIVDNTIFLTFTIVNDEGTVFDSTLSISENDSLASRELKLKTVDGDWIEVTFKRSRHRWTHHKWTHRR